jgi:hypothetical protein
MAAPHKLLAKRHQPDGSMSISLWGSGPKWGWASLVATYDKSQQQTKSENFEHK